MTDKPTAHEILVANALVYRGVFRKDVRWNKGPHPHFVVTDPAHSSGKCLVVNCATLHGTKYNDRACVLNTGDHDWIEHPSYIYYTDARLVVVSDMRAELLIDAKTKRLTVSPQLLGEAVLRRIQAGFWETGECSNEVHSFLLALKK